MGIKNSKYGGSLFLNSSEHISLNVEKSSHGSRSSGCNDKKFYRRRVRKKRVKKKKKKKKDKYYKRELYEWEKKHIIHWNEEDVGDWLEVIGFYEVLPDAIIKEMTSGKNLYLLEESDEIFDEVDNDRLLFIFFVYLHYFKHCVRSNKKFSYKFHFVLQKMMKIGLLVFLIKFSLGDVQKDWGFKELAVMTSLLSDKNTIKQHFLDTKTQNINVVKLKLIITETTFSKTKQLLRKVISPILNKIPTLKQDFGLFHSALLCGPFYLEWTDSELIIPKQIKSGSAYLTIDIPPIEMRTDQDFVTVKEILSEIILKWNTECRYSSIPSPKNKKGNCQTFILDIFNALGVELKVDGALKDFVDELNQKGVCLLNFKPCAKFINEFKLDENKYIQKYKTKKGYKIFFKTHRELDDFCYYCYQMNVEGYIQYPAEYTLLKRAFWLRHLKNERDLKYQPARRTEKRCFGTIEKYFTGCVFLDPRDTYSFVQ